MEKRNKFSFLTGISKLAWAGLCSQGMLGSRLPGSQCLGTSLQTRRTLPFIKSVPLCRGIRWPRDWLASQLRPASLLLSIHSHCEAEAWTEVRGRAPGSGRLIFQSRTAPLWEPAWILPGGKQATAGTDSNHSTEKADCLLWVCLCFLFLASYLLPDFTLISHVFVFQHGLLKAM